MKHGKIIASLIVLMSFGWGGLPTCFGDFWPVFLPNSGLELRVSWKYFIRSNANKDYVLRGLVPDISVPTTRRDLLLGFNPALEKVKEIVREELKKKPVASKIRRSRRCRAFFLSSRMNGPSPFSPL